MGTGHGERTGVNVNARAASAGVHVLGNGHRLLLVTSHTSFQSKAWKHGTKVSSTVIIQRPSLLLVSRHLAGPTSRSRFRLLLLDDDLVGSRLFLFVAKHVDVPLGGVWTVKVSIGAAISKRGR